MKSDRSANLILAALAGAAVALLTLPSLGGDKAAILGAMTMLMLGSIVFV